MSRYLLLATVGIVTLATGALGGIWSGRWRLEREPAAQLEQLPLAFGDWRGEARELDPKAVERAQFEGYVLRRYEKKRAVVNLLVARGRPGPLAVHTPEICYSGAGFHETGDPSQWSPGGELAADRFWKGTFARKDSASPQKLRILWGWHTAGSWVAVDNPRWVLAGKTEVYKLYVTQEFIPRDEATDAEGSLEFLRDFVPEFAKLFGQHP